VSDEASLLDARVQLRVSPERFQLSAKRAFASGRTFSTVMIVAMLFAFLFIGWKAQSGTLGYLAVTSPFIFVGLFLLRRSLLPLFQTTTIDLAHDGGVIVTAPIGGTRRLRLGDVRIRRGNYPDFNDPESVSTGLDSAVHLDHGRQTISFLIGYREAEQRHAVEALQTWLDTAAKRGAS
jgi:hypothetical protein